MGSTPTYRCETTMPIALLQRQSHIPEWPISYSRNLFQGIPDIPDIFFLSVDPTSTLPDQKIGSHGAVSIQQPYFEGAESISSIGVPQIQHFGAPDKNPDSIIKDGGKYQNKSENVYQQPNPYQ